MTPSPPTPPPYAQQWLDRGSDRIGLQWYELPDAPAAPTVLLWPAMGVPARYYRPFATALQQAGLAVVVADLRGTGASTPRASTRSRYRYVDLVADVGAGCDEVRRQRPDSPLVLLGHSLGGQACLLRLARDGGVDGVTGLALLGVGIPYWRTYQGLRQLTVLGFTQSIGAAATVLRVWPGWGFGGRQARGVIQDWAFSARSGRFPTLAGADPVLAQFATPTLAVSFGRDHLVPASAVDYLVSLVPPGLVRRVHVPGAVDHFSWARSGGPLAAQVAAFAVDPAAPAPDDHEVRDTDRRRS